MLNIDSNADSRAELEERFNTHAEGTTRIEHSPDLCQLRGANLLSRFALAHPAGHTAGRHCAAALHRHGFASRLLLVRFPLQFYAGNHTHTHFWPL